jgi:hypothetical protein
MSDSSSAREIVWLEITPESVLVELAVPVFVMLSISGYVVFSEVGIFAYGDLLNRRREAAEESCICLAGDCQNAGENLLG